MTNRDGQVVLVADGGLVDHAVLTVVDALGQDGPLGVVVTEPGNPAGNDLVVLAFDVLNDWLWCGHFSPSMCMQSERWG